MNTYTDIHARYYDLIYADKPYAREATFVAALLDGVPGARLLDLACGTGRHALELAALGYEVTGVDYSSELLERAAEHAVERGTDVTLVEQDMRRLDLAGARFDAVTCLFDSIGYPQSNAGVLQALAGVRRHLAVGGRFVVEFLHAAAMLRYASPARVRRFPTEDGGTLVRIAESRIDVGRHVLEVEYELLHLEPDGAYRRLIERQANRFFAVEEMRALLAAAGLEAERFVPAYADRGEIDDRTWHVIAVARAR